MFAVYNNGSVQFRSTSDNLYNLRKIDKSAESRHKPDDDLYQLLDNDTEKNKQKNYNNESLSAYKKIANLDTATVIYHVKDVMTKECITINVNSTLFDAYELLKEKKISQLPIVTDTNKIVNIINKKAILNLLMEDFTNGRATLNKDFNNIILEDFITTDPISDIRRVAQVMIQNKTDAIPVVNKNDLLVGIISKTDIINAVSHIPDFQLWA
jgi:CBS domain-containing protein